VSYPIARLARLVQQLSVALLGNGDKFRNRSLQRAMLLEQSLEFSFSFLTYEKSTALRDQSET